MYTCVPYVCSTTGKQKSGTNPLELELQKTVSCRVGGGNQTSIFCKSRKCSQTLSHLFSPNFNQYFKMISAFPVLTLKYSV